MLASAYRGREKMYIYCTILFIGTSLITFCEKLSDGRHIDGWFWWCRWRFRWLLVGTPTTAAPDGEMPLAWCPHHQRDVWLPLAWCPHHQREISVVVGGDTNNGFAAWDAAGLVSPPPARRTLLHKIPGFFPGCIIWSSRVFILQIIKTLFIHVVMNVIDLLTQDLVSKYFNT